MVEGILQALHEVDGVQATLVVNPEAQVLAHRAHAVYDIGLLSEVGRLIVSAIDSVQLVHDDWETLNATFADGKLLIRNLAVSTGGRAAALAVVADSRLNPSFAGVALRVAATRLKGALESPSGRRAESSFANSLPTPPPVLTSVPLVTPHATPLPLITLKTPAVSTPHPTADAAAAAFLAACTKALAGSVGPMAKVFVKEALQRLYGDQPFTPDQAPILVTALERHIDDPAERAQFRKSLV